MSQLWSLVKKELKELLTPTSLISVIAVVAILIMLGSIIGGETEDATSQKPIGYVDLTDDSGTDYAQIGIDALKAYYDGIDCPSDEYVKQLAVDAEYGSEEFDSKLLDAMDDAGVDTVIVITSAFNSNLNAAEMRSGAIDSYWNQTNLSLFSSISSVTSENAIAVIRLAVSDSILSSKTTLTDNERAVAMNPIDARNSSYATYLKGQIHEGVTPSDIYSALNQQIMFVPLIVMLIIVMIGSIVISSMGNEKENKTLETLLTLPVNRTMIVAGKLIGSTVAGLVMGALYMVGMYFYINGMAGGASTGVTMESLGLSLSILDWAVVTAFMFLGIIVALGLCMILGALARNYKAAQTYIMPISMLAVIPSFITMFSSIDSMPLAVQILLYAIPFTHPMTVMQSIMFGNTTLIVVGAIYLVLVSLALFYLTVRIYNSDILITGFSRKDKKGGQDDGDTEQ